MRLISVTESRAVPTRRRRGAKNIVNHPQVKARPLGRSLELTSVLVSDSVRPGREQFGLDIHRAARLSVGGRLHSFWRR
jgi:hypothetical protein